ncbi:MAG: UDP-glucose 4-epimerase GalE [Clostridia bacterium]|nr:UDP-glucose 4-epimerase GalE [Clostridia bacterium]
MKILVSGGAGFIGSHTCVELIKSGYEVVVFDNLCNSKEESMDCVEKITGVRPAFYKTDMRDKEGLRKIFTDHKIDAVIHFAGLKAVGESVEKPLEYYDCNIGGTLALLQVMREFGCKKIVFSSSATVYGVPKTVPITEDFPLSHTNPYGATKVMIEDILRDLFVADDEFSIMLLRYFNPIGAHESGLIGESPNGIPNNLMPRIIRVAKGEVDAITVFGTDYDTPDGTGVRDYIHVVDLAIGHIKAIEHLDKPGVFAYNLGTGCGYSVFDLVNTFSRVNGIEIKTEICPRRPGDVAECYANPEKAYKELGWKAELGIEDMCRSAWNFAKDK